MIGDTSHVGTLAAFDHRHHGFDLCSLAIGIDVESHLHESAVTTARRLVRRSTMLGGDDRANLTIILVTGILWHIADSGGVRLQSATFRAECFDNNTCQQ